MGVVNDNDSWVYWTQETQKNADGNYPDVTSIVDLLEAKGITWKAYAEDFANSTVHPTSVPMPAYSAPDISERLDRQARLKGNRLGKYPNSNFARRHIPFLSFSNIVNNSNRLAKIVDDSEFDTDLQNGYPA